MNAGIQIESPQLKLFVLKRKECGSAREVRTGCDYNQEKPLFAFWKVCGITLSDVTLCLLIKKEFNRCKCYNGFEN